MVRADARLAETSSREAAVGMGSRWLLGEGGSAAAWLSRSRAALLVRCDMSRRLSAGVVARTARQNGVAHGLV